MRKDALVAVWAVACVDEFAAEFGLQQRLFLLGFGLRGFQLGDEVGWKHAELVVAVGKVAVLSLKALVLAPPAIKFHRCSSRYYLGDVLDADACFPVDALARW